MERTSPAPPTSLTGGRGERLDFVFSAGCEGGRTLVVLGHGLTSAHDRPYLTALSDALAAAGLASLRFSFAGNGASEGAFGDCTLSAEVSDLRCVLDALEGWRVAYVGHSMGAAAGLLCADGDPRVRALVSLAGMVRVRAFFQQHFASLVPGRDFLLGRRACPLSQALLDDAHAIGDLLPQAARVTVPWLLVHGTADEWVGEEDSRAAAEACAGHAQQVSLVGADHRFSAEHDALCAAVVPWLTRVMAAEGGQ